MSKPYTLRTKDYSDKESFSFSFYCDRCALEWRSPTVPFTRGGLTEIENDEALQMVWLDEHRLAYEKANLDAQHHFNRCSYCGRKVCDHCFFHDEEDNGNRCRDCWERVSTMEVGIRD
jgi:hypothetical protein